VDASLPLDEIRGVALFNPIRDERFTALSSFPATVEMVTTLPNFAARLGNDNSTRVVLQFLYQYFRRVETIKFDEAEFEALWEDFLFELIESRTGFIVPSQTYGASALSDPLWKS
jgi:hypothetical protein